jgi:hypothetical protein
VAHDPAGGRAQQAAVRADAHHPPVGEHDVGAEPDLVQHLRQRAEVAGRVGLERHDQCVWLGATERRGEARPERRAGTLVDLEPDELDRQRSVVRLDERRRRIRRAVVDDEDP